jgi:threonine synthase
MGATCQSAKAAGATKLVGSSGGNAGMAMAYAAKKIGMPIVLFIPTSTPAMMVERLRVRLDLTQPFKTVVLNHGVATHLCHQIIYILNYKHLLHVI